MLSLDATFVFCLISFIVFIFLMKLICYGPITKVIEEREKFYEKNKKTVSDTNLKTEKIMHEFNEEISKAKLEGSILLKNTVDKNEAKKQEIIASKKLEISNSVKEYKENLKQSSIEAKKSLKNEISNYVKGAVSVLLNIEEEKVQFDENQIDEILK